MTLRSYSLIVACLAVPTAGLLADAPRAGFAESRDSFNIVRNEQLRSQRAGFPSEVRVGDVITAAESPVRVNMGNGSALVLSPNSSLTFAEGGIVELTAGSAAISTTSSSPTPVAFGDLLFSGPASDASTQAVYVLKVRGTHEVEVQVIENGVRVQDATVDTQVAYLASGAHVSLLREDGLWRSVAPGTGSPLRGISAQGPRDTVSDSTQSRGREGGAFLGIPLSGGSAAVAAVIIGGAVVIVGTAVLINELDDDDDSGSRPPVSAIVPFPPASSTSTI